MKSKWNKKLANAQETARSYTREALGELRKENKNTERALDKFFEDKDIVIGTHFNPKNRPVRRILYDLYIAKEPRENAEILVHVVVDIELMEVVNFQCYIPPRKASSFEENNLDEIIYSDKN